MRKISLLLIIIFALCSLSAFADDVSVIATYTVKIGNVQGVNNWYFCEYGTKADELEWSSEKGLWISSAQYPTIHPESSTPGTNDSCYKFVAPEKGMVRLKGNVFMPWEDSKKGDGVKVMIYKGKKLLWSQNISYDKSASYDITTSLRKNEELYFRINALANNYYDWTRWHPSVEYIDKSFLDDSIKELYFEKKNGELSELKFDEDKDGYVTSDGVGFISSMNLMPASDGSIIKRTIADKEGRYRVYANLNSGDIRGTGAELCVYKNGEKVWQQLMLDDEISILDVRMFCKQGDVIDLEISKYKYAGYNYFEWECDISRYVGTLVNEATSSAGYSHGIYNEKTLSSYITASQSTAYCYGIKNDAIYPMEYNSANGRWQSTAGADGGFVSNTIVSPGNGTDSCIDLDVSESGMLKITGYVPAASTSDGVVIKILHNNKELWSSRVGGERPVRWDEPYDVSYFNYKINVVSYVKAGDKITFLFDQWRNASNDSIDISDVKLAYVTGNVLSETTDRKLKNSTVIDTVSEKAYVNGKALDIDMYMENGTTYISADASKILFGADVKEKYVPVRNAAKSQNVIWAAERYVIIHSGIPVMYTWAELSEIEAATKGGVLFE